MLSYDQQRAILRTFFAPSAHITQPDDRELAQHLAILMATLTLIDALAFLGTYWVSGLVPVAVILLIHTLVSAVCYMLARTVLFRVSIVVAIIATFIIMFSLIIAKPTAQEAVVAIFPIYVVSIFTSIRYTVLASVISVGGVLLLAPYLDSRWQDTLLSLGYIVFIALMVIINTAVMQRAQNKVNKRNQWLLDSEARFRAAINGSLDAFILFETVRDDFNKVVDLRFVDVNIRAESMYKLSRHALVGQTVRTVNALMTETPLYRRSVDAVESRQTIAEEYHSSANRWFYMQIVPLEEGVAVSIRDIHERKQAEKIAVENEKLQVALEKERELNTLKTNLMSMISHEFRTPLAVIMNNTEILGRYYQKLTDEQREERLKGTKAQIKQLTHMLENISQVIKGSSERLQFNPDLVDLDVYAMTLFSQIREMIGADHDMRIHIEGHLTDIYVDVSLIHQIITNLLVNAVKFSPSQTVITCQLTGDEHAVKIVVNDQGIGIPKDDLQRVFEPFHRATNSETIRGTGLGLTIVKDCVECHQGSIVVDSVVNQGTRFAIELPIMPTPEHLQKYQMS